MVWVSPHLGAPELPLLKSAAALGLEMGNSPAVGFRHYRRPVGEAVSAACFRMGPRYRLALRILS